jgi:hypothetical protein
MIDAAAVNGVQSLYDSASTHGLVDGNDIHLAELRRAYY